MKFFFAKTISKASTRTLPACPGLHLDSFKRVGRQRLPTITKVKAHVVQWQITRKHLHVGIMEIRNARRVTLLTDGTRLGLREVMMWIAIVRLLNRAFMAYLPPPRIFFEISLARC